MHHGKRIRTVLLAAALLVALCIPAGTAFAREPVFLNTEGGSPERSTPAHEHPAPANVQDERETAEDRLPDLHKAEEGTAEEGTKEGQSAEGERNDGQRAEPPRPGDRPGPGQSPSPVSPKPELTDKQKKELAKLYKNLYETQKKLINKYAEYGVITREQASLWLSRLEARYERLKENGYVPAWKQCAKPEKPRAPR